MVPFDPTIPVTILKGLGEAFTGKGVTLTSDAVSTNVHNCAGDVCPWHYREQEWVLLEVANWPFRRWVAAKIVLLVAFEYNGCDLTNARCRLASKTFNRWYNDGAKYTVTATGGASKIAGLSGCPNCDASSTCVEFDVQLNRSWDWIRTAGDSWRLRICGDGTMTVQ